MKGARALAANLEKPATEKEVVGTIPRFRESTRIAEHEMHEVVLTCKGACVQMLAALPVSKPVAH